ncbi:type II toxin-antitoxin system RelE/ParE family toxin [Dyella choica]|uniref:type II toxin-antitoxin system RelE/ParE family toxin n=1 Tax=Dyella choica TaxID=1927959 RepID=UPI001E54DDFE|nr:type II toxin-antitoxin system RelE/ParE family toxin [Dyella choica]
MILYAVEYAPEAVDQLEALYAYLAYEAGLNVARSYIDGIQSYCEGLNLYPERGVRRDDIRPGLRITNHQSKTIVAFTIDHAALRVAILGIYHGGQDYEGDLRAKG